MTDLLVEADGGSRGNPGPAGYGAVVRDGSTAAVLARRNGFLGVATNNVAEYRGLIAGLQAAAGIDPAARVSVRMDSKLVVEQMSGRWQVKHPAMRPLAREAAALAAGFPQVSYRWIPRAENAEADRLANEAMDARRATYDVLDDTPDPDPDAGAPQPAAGPAGVGRPDAGDAGWRAPDVDPPVRLILLRHGQTELSVQRRFSGVGDPPLTAAGRGQARAAAERLARGAQLDAVITSPLRRARATAECVADQLGLTPAVDEAWRECDFGSFEGLTFTEVRERQPEALRAWLADPATAPPGGESFAAVTERVAAAREAIRVASPGRNVLVVSHVTPIKVLARLALGAPAPALYALHLDLASLSVVDLHPDGSAVLRRWNDTAHLEPGPA